MKKIVRATLAVLLGLTTSANAVETKVLACQFFDANGFNFENGKWNPAHFHVSAPFFIKLENDKVVSAGKFPERHELKCNSRKTTRQCIGGYGDTLFINLDTLNGAYSILWGASQSSNDAKRDTVTVELFTCETM